jgi:hypothetical protein
LTKKPPIRAFLKNAEPFKPSSRTNIIPVKKSDFEFQKKNLFRSFKHFVRGKGKLEKYNVIIPDNLHEIGIKNKNLSKDQLAKLRIVPEEILSDYRTTVMIKNIPNKYSQMQLQKEYLNMTHEGRYDFFYLPIDFKNQ